MELPGPILNLVKGLWPRDPATDPPSDPNGPKMERPKTDIASWLAALLVAWVFFSADYNLLAIRNVRAHPTDR